MRNYNHFGRAVLRTPLYSFSTLDSFGESEDSLKLFFSSNIVLESLYLASPQMHQQCVSWINNELEEGRDKKKLIASLLKYAIRMTSRATPFGLFANCSVVKIQPNLNDIYINDPIKIQRHSRLDMRFLCSLAASLENRVDVRSSLKFYPNSSIYFVLGEIRYVEIRYLKLKQMHEVVSVEVNEILEAILSRSSSGLFISEIVHVVMSYDINSEEALEYVNQLIDAQVLVSALQPTVTGKEYGHQIVDVLQSISEDSSEIKEIVNVLSGAISDLKALDSVSLGDNVINYHRIIEKLAVFGVPFVDGQIFQVDVNRNLEQGAIDESIFNDLVKGVDLLRSLFYSSSKTYFESFISQFKERYEDQEVPLGIVLDTDLGIGLNQRLSSNEISAAPLIEGVPFDKESPYVEFRWNKVQSFLLERLIEVTSAKGEVIEITEDDFKSFDNIDTKVDLNDTFSIMFSIVSNVRKGNGNTIFLRGAVGPTAGRLLGRFCHSSDGIRQLVQDISCKEKEMNPHAIHAEIVHLPESRIGNVLLRPIIREYEIPYLGRSGAHQEKQIPVSDLMISCKDNRLILRSKALNKEVIPYLTTAHTYDMSTLPIYHFLSAYLLQDTVKNLFLDWGPIQELYKFIPRVVYKNIVLSLARWRFVKSEYEYLFTSDDTKNEVEKWRNHYSIPSKVLLGKHGEELFIDFNNKFCVDVFLYEIKNQEVIYIFEFLFSQGNSNVSSAEGRYVNEYILPVFKAETKKYVSPQLKKNESIRFLKRKFILGDEWIYVKLYSGVGISESILVKFIYPLLENLQTRKLIDKWFFVRYYDPSSHIRLRLHLTNNEYCSELLKELNSLLSELLSCGMIWKSQFDTYSREIERYGSLTMEQSENLFHHDSNAVLELLSKASDETREKWRYLYGIKAVDKFLEDFHFSLQEKQSFVTLLKNSFYREFQVGRTKKKHLDAKFRLLRNEVTDLLEGRGGVYMSVNHILEIKSEKNCSIVKEILGYVKSEKLEVDFKDFVAAHIHMMINRVFKLKQRSHELVIYDFLARHYESCLKRNISVKKS